jgi:hypothetical protein
VDVARAPVAGALMPVPPITVTGVYLGRPLAVAVPMRLTRRYLRHCTDGALMVLMTEWGQGLSRGQAVEGEMRRRDRERAQ